MSNENYSFDGFQDLSDMLKNYISKVDNINDALKLPKPISAIKKAGYTHLIHTFSYRKKEKEIETGWGKYYGPMVENGTEKMKKAQPHLYPLWEKNKEKYYKTMITKLGLTA